MEKSKDGVEAQEQGVDVPFLEAFNARFDGILSNLVYWKVSLPTAGDGNELTF